MTRSSFDPPTWQMVARFSRVHGQMTPIGSHSRLRQVRALGGFLLALGLAAPSDAREPRMVLLPAGTFTMGSPLSEPERYQDETQTTVTITRDFFLSETPVTQGQWLEVMGTRPSLYAQGRDASEECPVEKVNWFDAVRFCNELSSMQGYGRCYQFQGDEVVWDPECDGYRLPTEAEWEYAARAGTTGPFSTGQTLDVGLANYDWEHPYQGGAPRRNVIHQRFKTTSPVRSFPPNPWGLYDMHGNVWEWCWDWIDAYPGGSVVNPAGPPEPPTQGPYAGSAARVTRGGSWIDHASYCRSAKRWRFDPPARFGRIGFRIARTQGSGNRTDPDARILVDASLPGTRILLDGDEAGFTPLTLSLRPGQSHRIEVDDHRVDAEEVIERSWEPAARDTLRMVTTARRGFLAIAPHTRWGRPVSTRVIIDDTLAVTAPWVGSVTAGRHELQWGRAVRGAYVGGLDTTHVQLEKNSPARAYRNSAGQQMEFVPGDALGSTGTTRMSQRVTPPAGLDRDLYVSATEVTQDQWTRIMGPSPSHVLQGNHPVEKVSWVDGVRFCNALSAEEGFTPAYAIVQPSRPWGAITGSMQYGPTDPDVTWDRSSNGYRLLTEAEWLHVRWAGAPHPSSERAQRLHTLPVGRFPATTYGIHDLIGNVHEWCWDLHRPQHPLDPSASPGSRIAQGSSWLLQGDAEGMPDRFGFVPTHLDYDVGFRVAREVR